MNTHTHKSQNSSFETIPQIKKRHTKTHSNDQWPRNKEISKVTNHEHFMSEGVKGDLPQQVQKKQTTFNPLVLVE
jgi:hypothetical protein